ncbi:unnamed protein product [Angiostrongylus costaricensis]|uniref:Gamma interferon inducible lysosomal thiol reductase n=1 Tax=Angiostrongylus costaricensis TaxID=334426 RepID=A0A0R3PAG8_ANGCS|nr:unnamed protein product [Angiostrongylus costaricensis]
MSLAPKLNKVSLEIYMESKCPDTSRVDKVFHFFLKFLFAFFTYDFSFHFRFLHKQLMKTWSMLSNTGRIELTMIPFGKARCVATTGDDYECTCQHGESECLLNQLMNCVLERIGVPDRTVPIIDCIQGRNDLDDAMKSCVTNNALLDEQWMKECATGLIGRRLLATAGLRTASLNPPLDFVPWIMIDGERNSDAYYDLTENLCKKLKPAPDECVVYMQNSKAR